MNIKRIVQHLLMTQGHVNKTFPADTLLEIEHLIKTNESTHSGEIRFVVEGALDGMPLFTGQSAQERALEVFSNLRIWDTEHNNGVLIYLLLADRDVEIIADRGIYAKVGSKEWEQICSVMESDFKQGNFKGGAVMGIEAVSQQLLKYFPASASTHSKNELPDAPVLL